MKKDEGPSGAFRQSVLIVGGGISGLATAWFLKQRGAAVTLLESRSCVGGAIGSDREGGYLTERGPNTIQLTHRAVQELIGEIGLASESRTPPRTAEKRFIVRDGKPVVVPSSLWGGVATPLFRLRGKLRLLGDLVIRRRTDPEDESVADFVRRRIGAEFLDYAINPMVGGVYAGDPERLSVRYAFPKIYRLEQEYGGLLKGTWGSRNRRKNDPDAVPSQIVSFRDGMEALPRRLGDRLGDAVIKGACLMAISPVERGWEVSWKTPQEEVARRFDRLVVTVPAHAMGGLPWSDELKEGLTVFDEIEYPPVASVALGFDRSQVAHPLDGFGVLVPEKEKRTILGTLFSSSMFDGRAPEGKVQITTFIGGARQPELALESETDLIERTVRENGQLLGIEGSPEYARVTVWKKAIPQYNVGYGAVLDQIDAIEQRWTRLSFCGNFRYGISVEKCILAARQLASEIAEAGQAGAPYTVHSG